MDARGPKRYLYCQNDPVNKVDPLGLAIYAFDGTCNDRADAAKMPTHVAALVQMYDPSLERIYTHGVGSRTEIVPGFLFGKGARERLDAAFAEFERIYAGGKGDTDIDIVGFSRGAAMAREFANMIKEKYPSAKIRFLGIFDTVPQVGSPDPVNVNPGIRLDIPDTVGFAAHAVARHEYRSLFPLTSIVDAYGGVSALRLFRPRKYGPSDYKEYRGKNFCEKPFDGAHSDLGGGYADGTNMEALWWMYQMGRNQGVPFEASRFKPVIRSNNIRRVVDPGYGDREYQQKTGGWHDSRYPVLDRIPFTRIGRGSRVIYSGSLQP